MEIKVDTGEQTLIVHPKQNTPSVSNTGAYDTDLLCALCDGILGRHEGYAYSVLQRLRSIQAAPDSIADIGDVNGDLLLRFAAGVAWKYTATQDRFGRIDIGPYSSVLEDVAFSNGPIPSTLDIALIRLVELDGDVYFYRAPVPARQGNINFVRFSVGSFVVFLKIDKRPHDQALPFECWLKGRTNGKFLIADASLFEEGKLHRELANRKPVQRFFTNMIARKSKSNLPHQS